jgi:hypothetical protein
MREEKDQVLELCFHPGNRNVYPAGNSTNEIDTITCNPIKGSFSALLLDQSFHVFLLLCRHHIHIGVILAGSPCLHNFVIYKLPR